MRVKDLIIEDFPRTEVSSSVYDACRIMIENKSTGIAIYQGKEPVGMVTERSLLRRFVPLNRKPEDVACREIMVPMLRIESKASIRDAIERLIKNGRTRLAVYEKGKFQGWVLLSDLVPYAMKRDIIHLFGLHGQAKGHDIMCPSCQSDFLSMVTLQDGKTVRWECQKCGYNE